jgi:hypothetical protein
MTGHFLNSLPGSSSGSYFVVQGTPIVTSGCAVADLDNAVRVCNDLLLNARAAVGSCFAPREVGRVRTLRTDANTEGIRSGLGRLWMGGWREYLGCIGREMSGG